MPIVRLGKSLCERVEVTKNGGFHSDPIAADGFAVDSFTDTRAAPLSTTRPKCWLSCDRKWWEPYRTCGTWSLHLILPPRLSLGFRSSQEFPADAMSVSNGQRSL
jgi:hypothetical protein